MTTTTIEITTGLERLAAQVENVAVLRNIARGVKEAFLAKQRAFEAAYAAEIADIKLAQGKVDEAEVELRALALARYAQTGETRPTAGVEIKVTHATEFDEKAALTFAKNKGIAVKYELDRKAFAIIAPTLSDEDKELVRYKETDQPKAYISTDLDKALEKVAA